MKVVVFDIDDTITNESDFIRRHAKKFFAKYGINPVMINPDGYKIEEIYNIEECYLNEGFSAESAASQTRHISKAFWSKYYVKYNLQTIKPGIRKYTHYLREKGYLIYFISLRGVVRHKDERRNQKEQKLVRTITKAMLKLNRICFDKLILVKSVEEKMDYIQRLNPELLFEDSVSVIESLHTANAIDALYVCVESPSNIKYIFTEDVLRIKSFTDSRSIYDAVTEKKVEVSNSMREWNKSELFQRAAIRLAGWYFVRKFRPTIVGSENIPPRGAVGFVGNHRDNLDPIMVSIYSGRAIHWAALLRLFMGKESLFNDSASKREMEAFSKFITRMGALPIARPEDEDHLNINMSTINELTELLKHNKAVGFFPEGTRNRRVTEQSLLPIKSNRVFRMACETESFLLPFSISWNKDRHVTIVFAKPINARKRNKKDVRDWWVQEVKTTLDQLDSATTGAS